MGLNLTTSSIISSLIGGVPVSFCFAAFHFQLILRFNLFQRCNWKTKIDIHSSFQEQQFAYVKFYKPFRCFSCQTGFYRFCCEGVYCPDCPLELNISTLGQNVSVNSALNLSCVNTSFTATFNTDRQPGNFTIKVS